MPALSIFPDLSSRIVRCTICFLLREILVPEQNTDRGHCHDMTKNLMIRNDSLPGNSVSRIQKEIILSSSLEAYT